MSLPGVPIGERSFWISAAQLAQMAQLTVSEVAVNFASSCPQRSQNILTHVLESDTFLSGCFRDALISRDLQQNGKCHPLWVFLLEQDLPAIAALNLMGEFDIQGSSVVVNFEDGSEDV